MIIDWSKAPEGATHYSDGNKRTGKYPAWWRPCRDKEGKFECWAIGTSFGCETWQAGPFNLPKGAIKQEWTGEGLPPVGVGFEWRYGDHAWKTGEALYIGSVYVILKARDEEQHYYLRDMQFRTIRTPEQIAAKARDLAIVTIIDDCDLIDFIRSDEDRRIVAAIIHDAGYRKQVTE